MRNSVLIFLLLLCIIQHYEEAKVSGSKKQLEQMRKGRIPLNIPKIKAKIKKSLDETPSEKSFQSSKIKKQTVKFAPEEDDSESASKTCSGGHCKAENYDI